MASLSTVATIQSAWVLTGSIGPDQPPQQIPVNMARFQVGRRSDLSLGLSSLMVSKVHAEILVAGDALFLRDLQSTNGTYVNGHRIERDTPLTEGDVIQFANLEFRVGRQGSKDFDRTVEASVADWPWELVQFQRLIDERAVVPHYQPVVDFADHTPMGYEVLARSKVQGLENPREMFITAARLNREAELSSVCRWKGVLIGQQFSGAPSLFVNTHPVEQLRGGVLASLRELREAFRSQKLVVELHEAAVTNPHDIKEFRAGLNDLDIELAYDDFGAGQARLLELVEVTPDYLKFDISLVRNLHTASSQRQQMVASLVKMVRELGIAALAEGIESAGEAEACEQIGFDLAQGYFFGRPSPIERYLKRPDEMGITR